MTNADQLGTILPYLPKDKRIISVTEVGSGMWNMRELSSDYDIVVIYSENLLNYLLGYYKPNLPCKHGVKIDGEEYDFSYMEFGHLIHLLKKGNINAIWATLSPVILTTSDLHRDLVSYIKKYPTKAVMPSLKGMVISQLSDAVKRSKVKDPKKNVMTAMRTVQFGLNLVLSEQYMFTVNPVTCTGEVVMKSLDTLESQMKESTLYDQIPVEGIEEILLKYRMQFLKEDYERRT